MSPTGEEIKVGRQDDYFNMVHPQKNVNGDKGVRHTKSKSNTSRFKQQKYISSKNLL